MDKHQKWDELNLDLLINVFARVGMEELLCDVPFVCKSWHKASHHPFCWQSLVFPELHHSATDKDALPEDSFDVENEPQPQNSEPEPRTFGAFYDKFLNVYPVESSRFSITGIVKVVVKRSNGLATSLTLPPNCVCEVLKSVSDLVPGLKSLSVWCDYKFAVNYKVAVMELFSNCANLETLSLESSSRDVRNQKLNCFLILSTNLHCKSVVDLCALNSQVCKDEIFVDSPVLTKLKYLSFRKCGMDRDNIIKLLRACTDLQLCIEKQSRIFGEMHRPKFLI